MERSKGSLTIKDFPTDRIEVECKKCGRHGRYRKATLIEKYGSGFVLPCSWIFNAGRQIREVLA